ncbi:hypothetical protein SAMN04487919_15013 [Bacillus sp. ok061]|uniref:hypothetical protein n=1 Tax=Bacillus sp. ok061 TaxID=1761766 RepID=UPI00089E9BAC|nr:hypothetical protein [Bacillus sp. ok061]SEG87098.1 hypothetical protein SAMN04487919_15013 [Bacillus sp. ok061]
MVGIFVTAPVMGLICLTCPDGPVSTTPYNKLSTGLNAQSNITGSAGIGVPKGAVSKEKPVAGSTSFK